MFFPPQDSPRGISELLLLLIISTFPTSAQNVTNTTFDPLVFVDPLIGSTGGGNVFAGASLPYGLAKAGSLH